MAAVLFVSIGVFRASLAYGTPFQQSFSGTTLSGSFMLSQPANVTQISANCSAPTTFPTPAPYLLVSGVAQGNVIQFTVPPTFGGQSLNWLSVEPSASIFDANKPVTFTLSGSLGVSGPTCTADFIGSKGTAAALQRAILIDRIWGAAPPAGLVPGTQSASSSGPLFLGYAAGITGGTLIEGIDVFCSGWSGVMAPLMLGATSNGSLVSWFIPADEGSSAPKFGYRHSALVPFSIDAGTTFFLQPLATGGTGNCTGTVSTVQGPSTSLPPFILQHFALGKIPAGVTYNFVSATGSSPTLNLPLGANSGVPVVLNAFCTSPASIAPVGLLLTETSGGVSSNNPFAPSQSSLFPSAVGWSGLVRTNLVDSNTTITVQPALSLGTAVTCNINLGAFTGTPTAVNPLLQDWLHTFEQFLRLSR